MKKPFIRRVPGLLITALLTIALTLFMAILVKTRLIPTKLLLVAGGIFLLFILSVCLLTRDSRRMGGMIAGSLMTILVLAVLMVGTPYLTKAVNMLGNITSGGMEVADISVYVENDSPLQSLPAS